MPYKLLTKECVGCSSLKLIRRNAKYCSQQCYFDSRPHPEARACLTCGKQFQVYLSAMNAGWGSGKYCSQACYHQAPKSEEFRRKISLAFSGEKHPNWKGGVMKGRKERNHRKYKEWRRAIFIRDHFICQICGISNFDGLDRSIKLNANHIKTWKDYPNLRYITTNGVTLCEDCHDLIRGKEKTWEAYFKTITGCDSEDGWDDKINPIIREKNEQIKDELKASKAAK